MSEDGPDERLTALHAMMEGMGQFAGLAMADLPAKLFDFWSKSATRLAELLDATVATEDPKVRLAVLSNEQAVTVHSLIDFCIGRMALVATSQRRGEREKEVEE